MSIEKTRSRWLFAANLVATWLALGALPIFRGLEGTRPWAGTHYHLAPSRSGILNDAVITAIFSSIPVLVVVVAVSAWQLAAMQWLGRRENPRRASDVAWVVCGHASVGWVIAGCLCSLAWSLDDLGIIDTGNGFVPVGVPWADMCTRAIGLSLGWLVYSWLALIGWRACRYA